MIRADAKEALWRWREVAYALGVGCVGVYWVTTYFGILQIVGYAVTCIAILLAVVGIQRGRFRNSATGQGVVTYIEGQVTYFGPYSGGMIAIDDISAIRLEKSGKTKAWMIEQPAQPAVMIPVDAQGADQLFDVFAALPGLKIEYMLSKLSHDREGSVLIWQRDTYLGANKYLH